jgi:hypothetical protein
VGWMGVGEEEGGEDSEEQGFELHVLHVVTTLRTGDACWASMGAELRECA